jgi:hypothetical protein
MKNYQVILVVVCSFYVFFGVLNGTIQQHIYFADPLNEMFVAAIAGTMGLLGLIAIDYKKLITALK